MSKVVNTKRDAAGYDRAGYQREMVGSPLMDANTLYEGFYKARRVSAWKQQVQRFEMSILKELADLQAAIADRSFAFQATNDFVLRERGRVRLISGDQIRDRVLKGVYADDILLPKIKPKLINDNGASLENKGVTFTRNRLLKHLRHYYKTNGNNEGYILLVDFVKYFDNIRHDLFRNIVIDAEIGDDTALFVLELILEQAKVDVSYLSPEEFSRSLDTVFNSLEYHQIDKSLLTGQQLMAKHFNIGCPVSQVAGIAAPMRYDNYIKIVKGLKYYARYMDDSYVIHQDKKYLEELLEELKEVAESIGITIHPNKTRIVKLSSLWRYMQLQYALTDTGRIIIKIHPDRLTAMRRKFKALAGRLTIEDFDQLYKSWFRNHYKYMSRRQRSGMDHVYSSLRADHYEIKEVVR